MYNGKVYRETEKTVAKEIEAEDDVLEYACGTGAISVYIAPKCKALISTDISRGMLRQAERKSRRFGNVEFKKADMTRLAYGDTL